MNLNDINIDDVLNRMVRGTLRRSCLYFYTKQTSSGSIPFFCFLRQSWLIHFISSFSKIALVWRTLPVSTQLHHNASTSYYGDQNEARSIRASAWSWPFKFLTNQVVVFRILITNLLIFQISQSSVVVFPDHYSFWIQISERRVTFSDSRLASYLQ